MPRIDLNGSRLLGFDHAAGIESGAQAGFVPLQAKVGHKGGGTTGYSDVAIQPGEIFTVSLDDAS